MNIFGYYYLQWASVLSFVLLQSHVNNHRNEWTSTTSIRGYSDIERLGTDVKRTTNISLISAQLCSNAAPFHPNETRSQPSIVYTFRLLNYWHQALIMTELVTLGCSREN